MSYFRVSRRKNLAVRLDTTYTTWKLRFLSPLEFRGRVPPYGVAPHVRRSVVGVPDKIPPGRLSDLSHLREFYCMLEDLLKLRISQKGLCMFSTTYVKLRVTRRRICRIVAYIELGTRNEFTNWQSHVVVRTLTQSNFHTNRPFFGPQGNQVQCLLYLSISVLSFSFHLRPLCTRRKKCYRFCVCNTAHHHDYCWPVFQIIVCSIYFRAFYFYTNLERNFFPTVGWFYKMPILLPCWWGRAFHLKIMNIMADD